jgi:hypothetical protein
VVQVSFGKKIIIRTLVSCEQDNKSRRSLEASTFNGDCRRIECVECVSSMVDVFRRLWVSHAQLLTATQRMPWLYNFGGPVDVHTVAVPPHSVAEFDRWPDEEGRAKPKKN